MDASDPPGTHRTMVGSTGPLMTPSVAGSYRLHPARADPPDPDVGRDRGAIARPGEAGTTPVGAGRLRRSVPPPGHRVREGGRAALLTAPPCHLPHESCTNYSDEICPIRSVNCLMSK